MGARPLQVHKLGGTSVGDADRIAAAADLLRSVSERARLVVVSSAMAGVTDELLRASESAAKSDAALARDIIEKLRERHLATLSALDPATRDGREREELLALLGEVDALLASTAILGELPARTRDRVVVTGEKLAVRLLAVALRARSVDARALDADTFLETDGRFGEASAMPIVSDRTMAAAILPLVSRGAVPVVTGFCGRAPDGATTCLGRGGSDLSATLLAAAIDASEVTIWTDVPGVFTANPRVVPDARVIAQLNYREAAELSYYGAKVLHPRTMIPAAARAIPVRTRSSFDPSAPGTVVDARTTPGSHPVKAISSIGGHALVSIEGKGMAGVPGVAGRVFSALARAGISVTMISQSSSESSICLALPSADATRAEAALKRELAVDLSRRDVEEIVVRPAVTLVAAVGAGMARTPGVAARVFSAVAGATVNVLAIAQGSSELNITVAVDARDADAAVRALHRALGLHQRDTGEETAGGLDVLILGAGRIGRAVAALLQARRVQIQERFGLMARIVAIADSSGFVLAPRGLRDADLARVLEGKKGGLPIAALPDATASSDPAAVVRAALEFRLARPILVDATGDERSASAYLEAFRRGCDVVTANKAPLAGKRFQEIREAAAAERRILRAEATVGAGLPIHDTLEMLVATGDRLTSIEGCLSGTLGFVMTRLEEGASLGDAVREASDLGYTEPDPVADLSGADVARKAVILARASGLATPAVEARLEGLVDPALAGLDRDTLLARLRSPGEALVRRLAACRERGETLRYVARVAPGSVDVGCVSVPLASPLGMLRGADNCVVFRSERYRDRPLVVTGPGAGIDVTAMGVVSDILRIAAERA